MFTKNCAPELGQKPTEELSLYKRDLLSSALEGTVRAKGRKLKKCKNLILFKEELSNNLCSPKMELADSRSLSVPAEPGGHLSGTVERASTRPEAELVGLV